MNSPNKSATISVTDFLFLHHFFKHLLSRTRVNSKKLIVNQLQSQHQKAVLMTGFGINKQPSGFDSQRLSA